MAAGRIAWYGVSSNTAVLRPDEFSLEGGLRISAGGDFPVKYLALGDDNILGRGIRLHTQYSDVDRRASFDTDLLDTHFLGRRVEAELEGGKSQVGPVVEETIRRAFEIQLEGKGFSIVEVLSTCPTNWGLNPAEAIGEIKQMMVKRKT